MSTVRMTISERRYRRLAREYSKSARAAMEIAKAVSPAAADGYEEIVERLAREACHLARLALHARESPSGPAARCRGHQEEAMSRGMTRRLRIERTSRTAKQREAAERVKRAAPRLVIPVTGGPATSWWMNVSRDELQRRARAEQPRIATSRFGRMAIPSGGAE